MISLILSAALSGAAFTCDVIRVHDGDTFTCSDRRRVRVAGIQAPDFADTVPCREGRAEYVCSDAAARASQRTISALVLRRRLACQALEPSYDRIVARCRLPDGRDLSCAVLAAGAATRWDRYWRRYNLGACPAGRPMLSMKEKSDGSR